jgi:predicted protein tyrosine phosphatase
MKHDPEWVKILKQSEQKTEQVRAASQKVTTEGMEIILQRPVLGKILILPRSSIEKFSSERPWACISIGSDEPSDFPSKLSTENRLGFIRLEFADLEGVSEAYRQYAEIYRKRLAALYSKEQAKQVVEFVKPLWDKIDLLVIHCHAGLSRSTGIGKALAEVYDPEKIDFYDKLYMPNKLVYNLTLEACRTV